MGSKENLESTLSNVEDGFWLFNLYVLKFVFGFYFFTLFVVSSLKIDLVFLFAIILQLSFLDLASFTKSMFNSFQSKFSPYVASLQTSISETKLKLDVTSRK